MTGEAAAGRIRLASHAAALVLGGLALALLVAQVPLGDMAHGLNPSGAASAAVALALAGVGLVVAWRQPRNLMGWVLGMYAGLVALVTGVLPFSSPVAVAVSTLAAAALFNPLRRWVQRAVDRRFNRARYDADRMVAQFAARLKDAVDLDAVRADLAGAVHQALEPAHVSVWIARRGTQ